MKKYYIIGLMSLTLLFSGCAELNNTLSSLSSIGSAPQQDLTSLIPEISDNLLKQQITEAKPVMQTVLSELACMKGSKEFSKVRKYFTAYALTNPPAQSAEMSNHVSGCLKIVRTQYWNLAKNTFAFEAIFESPQSGESVARYFKMQKQENGEWLFAGYNFYNTFKKY